MHKHQIGLLRQSLADMGNTVCMSGDGVKIAVVSQWPQCLRHIQCFLELTTKSE